MMNLKKFGRLTRLHEERQGSSLVIALTFLVTLLAFGALAVDFGLVMANKRHMQECADVAALAAVREWTKGNTYGSAAIQTGNAFALTNGFKSGEVQSITCGIWVQATKTFVPGLWLPGTVPAVKVVANRDVPMSFGKAIGISQMSPGVKSVAIGALASSGYQVLPWAVCNTFVPVEGVTVTIQFRDGGETNACGAVGSGSFGQLSFGGGSGASTYRDMIFDGYKGVLRVGDIAYTDPGGSWGPTVQGIDERLDGLPPFFWTPGAVPGNKRGAILPQVSNLDVSGRKAVTITGFYAVSLDGYDNANKTVTVTFLNLFAGTSVDPSAPPRQGNLSALAIVQ